VIEVRLPADTLAALDAAAERLGRTRANVVRDVLGVWAGEAECDHAGGLTERPVCEACGASFP
jgi:predicted DNA-binding protein